jgi:para-aminobenzoate synthetase/4-amino-4-deoxychorismate lyase
MHVILRDGITRQWLRFDQAVEIVEAHRIDDVIPALARIEALVNDRRLHAAGFISYEAAPAFDRALSVRGGASIPLLWFGLFPAPTAVDSLEPVIFRLGDRVGSTDGLIQQLHWTSSVTRAAYDAGIDRIKSHIAEGDTYQVNYTFRLRSPFNGDSWALLQELVHSQDAGYAAFIDTGAHAICSVSPELFFRLDGTTLICNPMKGTAPRGRFPAEDRARAEWLRESEKNRAENVMIVDMVRNDIGRVAKPGSVRVPSLFDVTRYPTLWQMTSTVTGETDAGIVDIMAALFPCASITGAPKPRTMQIIADVESTPRGLYTGCIGFIAPGRHAQFSVAIRTAVIDRSTEEAEYGVGGGILWESETASEYAECLAKARVVTERRPDVTLLETILWEPAEGHILLSQHLARLTASADYFDIPLDPARVRRLLFESAAACPPATQIVRLLVSSDGSCRCEALPFVETPVPVRVALAPRPVDSSDIFLFHKTTARQVYDDARAACPAAEDVVLFNERGEITESTIANIVVDIDGGLFTPPVSCGLLGGTLRAELLANGVIRERVITVEMLTQCRQIHLVNSVRGWRPATLVPEPI